MKLAELFIEFTTKGVDAVQSATQGILGKLSDIVGVAGTVGKVMSGVAIAAAPISAIFGSTQWQVLEDILERLSNTLGSVFVPILELLMDIFDDLLPVAEKFAEELQPHIQEMADAFWLVWKAVRPLIDAALEMESTWLSSLVDIATAITKILVPVLEWVARILSYLPKFLKQAVNEARSLLGLAKIGEGERKPLRRLTPGGGGGFEDVAAVYQRIAQASLRVGVRGKSSAERTNDLLEEKLIPAAEKTADAVTNLRPAVA